MRIKSIVIQDILPIKQFSSENLSDVIVLAGPNGVGKTRLIEGLLSFFQNPRLQGNVQLLIEATNQNERTAWQKQMLDTNDEGDCQKLLITLQRDRRRNKWESSILNFDSDRSIQQINPFPFSWDMPDPWLESVGWSFSFSRLRDRFQDTLHSIFRKVKSRENAIAKQVVASFKAAQNKNAIVEIKHEDFPDPLESFKQAFSQLLAPKTLLDPDPQQQQLFYEYEGQPFPITSLSSGEREVVNIVFDFILRNPNDCVVVFDEPELHLHPELSYKLLQTLRAIGTSNQFIFCTHSPDIITASLDQSVIFIAPPKSSQLNQAVTVQEEDETHQALKLLGQSIGIVALGKKIIIIEGSHTSIDKQTYGTILKNRFPNLVLVPGGGKGILTSFATLHKEVLERTIWGVDFYMLCDRDAVPPSKNDADLEAASRGRLKVLKRYHIENFFLDENVLSQVFADMEPEGSWLRSPTEIKRVLKEIAQEMISYTAALTASAYYREVVGNLDIMPKDCHSKTSDELKGLIIGKVESEKERFSRTLDFAQIETYIQETVTALEASLSQDTDEWKKLIPGKPILRKFAARANLDFGRLKILFLKEAEKYSPNPFAEIFDVFSEFNQ